MEVVTRQYEVNLQVTTVRFRNMTEPYGLESRKLPGAVRTHSDAGGAGSHPVIPAGGADGSEREGKDTLRLRETHTQAGHAHRGDSVCRWPFFVVNFGMSTP